jgi:hypothetical protein
VDYPPLEFSGIVNRTRRIVMDTRALLDRPRLIVAVALLVSAGFQLSRPKPTYTGCVECRIRLTRSTIIGTGSGKYAPSMRSSIAQLGDGTFAVAPVLEPGAVAVFAPSGRFLRAVTDMTKSFGPKERAIGRVWSFGPDSLAFASPRADLLAITDSSFAEARVIPTFGRLLDLRIVPGAGYIANAVLEHAGSVHLFARDGRFVRTVDRDSPGKRNQRRLLAVDDSGRVYYAHPETYEIMSLADRREPQPVLRRPPDWFRSLRRADDPPFMVDLEFDANGVLWTVTMIPQPNFKDSRGPEYILEAIDVSDRSIIATARSRLHLGGWIGRGQIAAWEQMRNGQAAVVIWNVQLTGRR